MDLSIKKVSIKTRRRFTPFIILMLTLDSHVHRWEDTSLSIVIFQHTIVLMIGTATYPHATFGFSITSSTVLHLGHMMVLPRYPSSATRKMTVCLSLGSPLHISVLPQPGTGQRAMGMRFILPISTSSNSCHDFAKEIYALFHTFFYLTQFRHFIPSSLAVRCIT